MSLWTFLFQYKKTLKCLAAKLEKWIIWAPHWKWGSPVVITLSVYLSVCHYFHYDMIFYVVFKCLDTELLLSVFILCCKIIVCLLYMFEHFHLLLWNMAKLISTNLGTTKIVNFMVSVPPPSNLCNLQNSSSLLDVNQSNYLHDYKKQWALYQKWHSWLGFRVHATGWGSVGHLLKMHCLLNIKQSLWLWLVLCQNCEVHDTLCSGFRT